MFGPLQLHSIFSKKKKEKKILYGSSQNLRFVIICFICQPPDGTILLFSFWILRRFLRLCTQFHVLDNVLYFQSLTVVSNLIFKNVHLRLSVPPGYPVDVEKVEKYISTFTSTVGCCLAVYYGLRRAEKLFMGFSCTFEGQVRVQLPQS